MVTVVVLVVTLVAVASVYEVMSVVPRVENREAIVTGKSVVTPFGLAATSNVERVSVGLAGSAPDVVKYVDAIVAVAVVELTVDVDVNVDVV